MGRPGYYVPSASTVSRDVRLVFGRTRERIVKLLKVNYFIVSLRGKPLNNSLRNMTVVSTWLRTVGHHQTTMHTWLW